jgi:pilus assembly protein TadC
VLFRYIAEKFFPNLQHQLRVAHIDATPDEFVRTIFVQSSMYVFLLGFLLFMLADSQGWGLRVVFFGMLGMWLFGVWFGMQRPKIQGYSRAKDIDKEVIFAGRFLLVKLHSGKPLLNALFEASESYGVANSYFKEIVRDIELGTPLEEAIERAMTYSPSEKFQKILFQIHNALRLGMNVTKSLEAVLDEIQASQLLEIQDYGKKLGTVTLFYMLVAIVFPSLGMTIATVILAFTEIQMDVFSYGAIIFFLVILNFIFITVFRGIRPKLNI